jgi:hypothetical protein
MCFAAAASFFCGHWLCVRRTHTHARTHTHTTQSHTQPHTHTYSWRPGAASRLWQQCALASLSRDLVSRYGVGAAIIFRPGPYAQALAQVRCARLLAVCGFAGWAWLAGLVACCLRVPVAPAAAAQALHTPT